MSAKQRKRQSFAAKQRERRKTWAIIRANCGKPGFIGAVRNVTINGVKRGGIGAIFLVIDEPDNQGGAQDSLDKAVSIETGIPVSVLRADRGN